MSDDPTAGPHVLRVTLTAAEASAIVYTIAFEAVTGAEHLDALPVSSQSPHLLAISAHCARICRLAAINDQLGWCAQRRAVSDPVAITATQAVLLELADILEATARGRRRFPDAQLEEFAFDPAAKAIRATLRTAGL